MNNEIITISKAYKRFYTYAQPLNPGILVITWTNGSTCTTFLPNGYIDYDENKNPFIRSSPESVKKIDAPKKIEVSEENLPIKRIDCE